MSNTVGYVLLGSAAVPGLLGWNLARKGLADTEAAAKEAKRAATDAATMHLAANQAGVAQAEVAASLGDVQQAISGVDDALKGLTGYLAPARVAFALATLLVVAALFALGVISASVGSNTGGTTTTVTTSA